LGLDCQRVRERERLTKAARVMGRETWAAAE